MARKVTPEAESVSSVPEDGTEDLAILHGEVVDEIDGESITFREYTHMQGLRLRPLWLPIMEDIARSGLDSATDGEGFDASQVFNVLAEHVDAVPTLIGAACGKEPAWYESLGDADGERAILAWWAANAGFFERRVGNALATLAMKKLRAGPTSTPS